MSFCIEIQTAFHANNKNSWKQLYHIKYLKGIPEYKSYQPTKNTDQNNKPIKVEDTVLHKVFQIHIFPPLIAATLAANQGKNGVKRSCN